MTDSDKDHESQSADGKSETVEDRINAEWKKLAIPPRFQDYRLSRKGTLIVLFVSVILLGIFVLLTRYPFFNTRGNLPSAGDFPIMMGHASRVAGYAQVVPRNADKPQELKEGAELTSGDRIHTPNGSRVIFFLESKGKIVVQGDSQVSFQEHWEPSKTGRDKGAIDDTRVTDTLTLDWGNIEVELRKEPTRPTVLEIKTPSAIAVLNPQTRIAISLDKTSRKARFSSKEGTIELQASTPDRPTLLRLQEFHQVSVDLDGRLDDIRLSLPPPTLLDPSDSFEMDVPGNEFPPIKFRWEGIGKEGVMYQFEIGSDKYFETIIFTTQVSEPSVTVNRLDSGDFFWRVRGVIPSPYPIENPWSETRQLIIR